MEIFDVLNYLVMSLVVFLVVRYNWRRRYLYFYGAKIPGDFSLPIFGGTHLFIKERKDFLKGWTNIIKAHPSIWRLWLGPQLLVCTSRPQDIEIILNMCLEKASFYEVFHEFTNKPLLTVEVDIWRKRRKLLSRAFKPKTIHSFVDVFNKNGRDVVSDLEGNCGKEEEGVFLKVWQRTLEGLMESIGDLNSEDYAAMLNKIMTLGLKSEELMVKRIQEPWLLSDFLWKLSSSGREAQFVKKEVDKLLNLILDIKEREIHEIRGDATRQKHLLNYMCENLSRDEVVQEAILFGIAGSETVASTITNVLLMLGMFEDIQEKVYEELNSIFGIDDRKPSLGDLNRMEYLQRVIKETLRVFPATPFIARHVSEDVFLDPYTIPRGSRVIIPILLTHRNPEIWDNPMEFNPDRFLREEAIKRHHCSYIPFSFGARNCIGFYYALVAVRVTISNVIRAYKIKTSEYKSLEDIELHYSIVTRPEKYRIVFEKR